MRIQSPSICTIRISVLLLTVAILAGCLEQPDTSASDMPDLGVSAAAKVYATEYDTLVAEDGRQIVFPTIHKSLLKDGTNRLFAVVHFQDGSKFEKEKIKLGLNGIRGRHSLTFDLASDAEWELNESAWVLYVDLTGLKFRGGQSVLSRIAKVQAKGGQVQLWISAPKKVARLELRFSEETRDRGAETLPRVIFDRIQYGSSAFFHRVGSLYFHADRPVRGFECSLNHSRFRSCQSPATYWLRPGYHVFRARAISLSGRRGPVMVHHFKKHWHSDDVRITSTNPEESPTTSNSMEIHFQTRSNPPWFLWEWILRLAYNARCRGHHGKLKACVWLKDQIYGGHWGTHAECQLDGNGFFACQSPVRYSNLNEGAHTVVVRSLRDEASADEYSWIVDAKKPEISWTETPEPQTSETIAKFGFVSNEEVDFFCSLDGASPGRCNSPVTLRNLDEGEHRFAVYGVDIAGNRSDTQEYLWRVDNGAPVLTLTQVSPSEAVTSSRRIRLDFEANEPATFRCIIDSTFPPTDLEAFTCNSPYVVDELSEGEHTVRLMAVDLQGNQSEVVEYHWTIDATAPAISLSLLSPSFVPTAETQAQFQFSSSEALSFSCTLDGASLGGCSSPFTVSELGEGSHSFVVRAMDVAGNEGTNSFNWDVDLSAPVITLGTVIPAEEITESHTLEVQFSVSESAEVLCELDGGGQVECASPYVVNELADGEHELIISATDAAGNYDEITYYWTVTSPVVVTLDSVTPEESPTISSDAVFEFSSNNAESYECLLDDGAFEECDSPMAYSGLENGDHNFQVRGISALGEPGEVVSYSWSIDNTPLEATQVSVSQITQNTALITWTTNVPADSRVNFGIGTLNREKYDAEMTTSHVVLIDGLQSNSLYSFQVSCEDFWSRYIQSELQTFRTLR
ncbi:MAG: fibronectin type III domain-containing protein [Bdellovibrionales bacterium]|nr:fibronectin type III domain-containing protein [Bdellovibrionales bacterium]